MKHLIFVLSMWCVVIAFALYIIGKLLAFVAWVAPAVAVAIVAIGLIVAVFLGIAKASSNKLP